MRSRVKFTHSREMLRPRERKRRNGRCSERAVLFVRIDARAAALDRQPCYLRPLHHPRNRFRDVFHVGWLQPRFTAPKHRKDGKAMQQFDEGVEELIIAAEQHGWSDHCRPAKDRADGLLSLATGADVR